MLPPTTRFSLYTSLLNRPYHQTIDIVMLTATTNCITNVINKQSHGLECNLGIIAWQFRLLITLAIAHVINSLNRLCNYSQIAF